MSEHNNVEEDVDVRQTMLEMSANPILQFLLTILTGRALPNQRPLFNSNAAAQFGSSFVFLVGGVIASSVIYQASPLFWFLFAISWLFTVAGARKFQTEICHQISHGVFTGNKVVDRVLMELISTILWIQDYAAYQNDHRSHHSTSLATLIDPDVVFQIMVGFKPGMSKTQLWKHLVRTIFSPVFHMRFFYYRLKANFLANPLYRRLMSIVWLTVLITFVTVTGSWIDFLVVWIFPLIFLYQISALLQFLTEHRWLRIRQNNETKKVYLAKLTVARLFGEPYPARARAFVKLQWFVKMIFYHGATRLFVCPGTLPAHDAHHRYAGTSEWANLIFLRQRDIDAGCPNWGTPYMEVWGLHNALDKSFEHFAALPPIPEEQILNITSETKQVILGM